MKKILLLCCFMQSVVFAQSSFTILGDTSLCPGQSTTLQVSDNFVSYQWFMKSITIPGLPDPEYVPIGGATADTLVINYFDHTANFIRVRVVDANSDTLYSGEKEIVGYAFLNPYLVGIYNDWQSTNPDTGEVFICPGDTVGLQFMPEYFYDDILWNRDGQLVSTDTTHMVTEAGFYEVGGKSALCPNYFWTALQVSWCMLSTEENQTEEIYVLNPVSESFLMFSASSYFGSFQIFNGLGEQVLFGEFQNGRIDVSTLNSGIYFLTIADGKRMKFIR